MIGAGPGGLVAARFLKSEGFEPVLFEHGASIGGQWSGDPARSGVWPGLRTNTSRIMTAFSDLPHPRGTPVYPSNQQMLAYLNRYAECFDLHRRIRLGAPVHELRRSPDQWVVRTASGEEAFERVVVATGRFNRPSIPALPGIGTFPGRVGHTFDYQNPEVYRGLRVIVAGCAVSALEIASDLAMLGAARVVMAQRKQRYVLPKLLGGIPSDHQVFTRFAALAAEALPPRVNGERLRQMIVSRYGSPEQFGAQKPHEDLLEADVTLSQHFLPLVAEGKIHVKPWIQALDGNTVTFSDGSSEEADAILFGTGFEIHLPFLSPGIRDIVALSPHTIDLYKYTFHPDLPGLAFLGLIEQKGPYYPVLELQARWIAYTWSLAVPQADRAEMEKDIRHARVTRKPGRAMPMHVPAIQFARAAGVEPDPDQWPQLHRALLFGPLAPVSFRLSGRDALPHAAARFVEEAREFGHIESNELTAVEAAHLETLAAAAR